MSTSDKIKSGLGWGTLGLVVQTVLQLFLMGIMARLLEPKDFGLVAIAGVSLRFFSYFSQLGISPALVQKEELNKSDISAALSISLTVSSFFAFIAILLAPYFESFFKMPGLTNVLRLLAINFILISFFSISQGLLQREHNFKILSLIDVVSYAIGYGVIGITSACYGLGVWALVTAIMSQTIIKALIAYFNTRHSLLFKHKKESRNHFIGFGSKYSVIGFIEFITVNIIDLTIGKFLGPTSSGIYNRAQLITNLPVQHPASILTKTLFPIISSFKNDKYQRQSLEISLYVIGTYCISISTGIYMAAEEITLVLLGDQWVECVPVIKVLSLALLPMFLSNIISTNLDACAKLKEKFYVQLSSFVILLITLTYSIRLGTLNALASCIVIMTVFRLFCMIFLSIRVFNIKSFFFCKLFLQFSFICISMITCVYLPKLHIELPSIIALILVIILCAISALVSTKYSSKIFKSHDSIQILKSKSIIFKKVLA